MRGSQGRRVVVRLLGAAIVVLVCLGAAGVGWWLGASGPSAGADLPATAEGSSYPAVLRDFRLPSLDGREIGPTDYSGRVVLVEFWATWCGPCHVQAKILASLHEELAGEPIQFLAVSVGEDRKTVERFVEERPFPYPVLLDSSNRVADAAEIYALPTLMVIDARGEVIFLQAGISNRRTLLTVLGGALQS